MPGHLLAVLSLIACFRVAHAVVTAQQMIGVLAQFTSDFTWPNITQAAAQINYTGFTPDIVGRVDVTNAYQGSELNTEYLFGLFASIGKSNTTRLIGLPLNATIVGLAVTPPIITFSSIRNFDWGPVTIPVQIDGWLLFDNDSGLIAQYDFTFRRLAWAWDYVKPFLLPQLVEEVGSLADNSTDVDDLIHLRAAIDVCQQHDIYCTDSLQQYDSIQACIDYVHHQIPMGAVYEWGGDTAMCRWIHKGMILYRPNVHCPHIGPSGGGMCIKRDYINETTQQLYPIPFLPSDISNTSATP